VLQEYRDIGDYAYSSYCVHAHSALCEPGLINSVVLIFGDMGRGRFALLI
jgi:hypothetical protein